MRGRGLLAVAGALAMLTLACEDDEPTGLGAGTIGVYDTEFSPAELTRYENQPVTWRWLGTEAHNIVFDDGEGNAPDMTTGEHTRTFTVPGTYGFRCTNHSVDFSSGMSGFVLVLDL
jgi:plastocyanin